MRAHDGSTLARRMVSFDNSGDYPIRYIIYVSRINIILNENTNGTARPILPPLQTDQIRGIASTYALARKIQRGVSMMRIHVRWIGVSVVTLFMAILLSVPGATIRSTVQAAQPAPPIRLGWIGPLTPPGAFGPGKEMKSAVELATDEINAQGGVLGRRIEVIYEDSRGTPEQGTAAMDRLVTQEHVVAVSGEFHPSAFLAEMEVAHRQGIPIVGADVWANVITAKGYPEVFRVAPSNALIVTKIGNWVSAAGFKNVALLFEKGDVATDVAGVLTPILREKGIHYDLVTAELNTTEWTSQMIRFKAHTPPYDLLLADFPAAGAYPLVNQSKIQEFAPSSQVAMYLMGGSAVDPTFWKVVGENGVHLVAEVVGLPKSGWNNKTKALVESFTKRFGNSPPPHAIENYDAQWIIAEAIKRAGDTSPAALIRALEKTDWVGARGRYTFSLSHNPAWTYHQFMNAPVIIIQYSKVDQKPEDAPIVWPRDLATVKYTYERP